VPRPGILVDLVETRNIYGTSGSSGTIEIWSISDHFYQNYAGLNTILGLEEVF
jgi:hypothetical protein